ncbi:MAG: hypothetical protein U9N72_09650 [Bacteroidota bacterium]|nr:hypothetical protein [Bacteroidota bacterium]
MSGRKGYQNYEYGGYMTGGFVIERNMASGNTMTKPVVIASPFAEYNWHWLGIGANAKIGYVPYIPMLPSDSFLPPDKNHKITPVMPGFMARFGPYDWLDAQLRFFSGFPEPLPTSIWDLSLGTGFGMTDGSGLRIGTTFPHEGNIYFRGHYLIDNRFGLTLRYKYGKNYFTDEGVNNEFAIAVSYLLDNKIP